MSTVLARGDASSSAAKGTPETRTGRKGQGGGDLFATLLERRETVHFHPREVKSREAHAAVPETGLQPTAPRNGDDGAAVEHSAAVELAPSALVSLEIRPQAVERNSGLKPLAERPTEAPTETSDSEEPVSEAHVLTGRLIPLVSYAFDRPAAQVASPPSDQISTHPPLKEKSEPRSRPLEREPLLEEGRGTRFLGAAEGQAQPASPNAPSAPAALPLDLSTMVRLEVPGVAAPVVAPTAPPLWLSQAAHEDSSLHVRISPERAELRVDAGDQQVRVELRVQDGVTDIRMESPTIIPEPRAIDELRGNLASAGLSLGRFDHSQGQHARRDSSDPDERHPETSQKSLRGKSARTQNARRLGSDAQDVGTEIAKTQEGRHIHVKA